MIPSRCPPSSPSWSLKTLQHAPFVPAGKTWWGTSKTMYVKVPAGRCCVQETPPHFSGLSECLGPSVTEMYVQNSFSRYHWWLPPCTLFQVSYKSHFLNSHSLHHLPPSLARTTPQWSGLPRALSVDSHFMFHILKIQEPGDNQDTVK